MRKVLLPVFFFLSTIIVNGQYFQTGQDPSFIRWRQINTNNFQLIYPSDFEFKAQRLAYVLERVYQYGSYSLNHRPKKISLILHTRNNKSNGLVAVAPKRAEFFTIPEQSINSQDWLEQLALHEFRHVVQVDKVDSLMPKIIKFLLGEQGTALVIGACLPFWFLEGDAIVTESLLSNYGRGRSASFLMESKAQVIEKGIYSLDKAYNGSFRDFVPNHYNLGYNIVANGRERYGSSLWDKVVTNSGKNPFSLTPFNNELKKQIGMNKEKLYMSIYDSLRNIWISDDKTYKEVSSDILSREKGCFTSYEFNYLYNAKIITYKTSIKSIPKFVKISREGKENTLFIPGRIHSESINYKDNFLIWSERLPDMRWTHSGKTLVRIFDLENGKLKEFKTDITSVAPAISPDKARIAFSETDFSNNYFLSVYTFDGHPISSFQAPGNFYFLSPCWIDDNTLATIILTSQGKKLALYKLNRNELEYIEAPDWIDIKQLQISGGNLYFISSYSGKNELYVFDFSQKKFYRVCTTRFGSDYPAFDTIKGKIILSDYTSDGYRLIEIPNDREKWEKLEDIKREDFNLPGILAKQELGIPDFTNFDTTSFHSKRYIKIEHLFQFHSWAPAYINANRYSIEPGFSVMSQNKLGTAQSTLGYRLNTAEKTGQIYADFTYKGFYPVFKIEANAGKRATDYMVITNIIDRNGKVIDHDTTIKRFTRKETNFSFDTKVPLNLSTGKYNRLLQPGLIYDYTFIKQDSNKYKDLFNGQIQSITYNLYYHHLINESHRDLLPYFGVVVDLKFRHTPWGNRDLGTISCAQAILYLPGLVANHGIRIYNGFQKKNPAKDFHAFGDLIRYPRGWSSFSNNEIYSLGLDYKFPITYPDCRLLKTIYIQRLKCSLFNDYAFSEGNVYSQGKVVGIIKKSVSSFGAELTGDLNIVRFYAPVEMGVRAGFIPGKGSFFNFLFSVDFSSF